MFFIPLVVLSSPSRLANMLSVIFYGHPLMTLESLSASAFSSLLWSCVSTLTLFGPRKQAVQEWHRLLQGSPWVDSN